MAATTRRPARDRKPASTAAPQTTTVPSDAIDGALDDWAAQGARELLAAELATSAAWLRAAHAVLEARRQATEEAEATRLQAAGRLAAATSTAELMQIRLELLQANADEIARYWSRLGDLAMRGWADTWQDAGNAWAKLIESSWQGFGRWSSLQASMPAQPAQVLEAEMEHLVHPLEASPLLWPSQEAARQAMGMANNAWNEWMSWSKQVAEGGVRPH